MTAVINAIRPTGRSLVDSQLFERLVARVAQHQDTDRHRAERIMDQALAFLAAAAHHTGEPLSPSEPVDIGWHTFILYTREYAAFCEDLAGLFLHHVPDDVPVPSKSSTDLGPTMAAIELAGYAVDVDLWAPGAKKCGSCHEEGNCSASGKEGNENSDTRKK